jgi:hypothetical protein
MDGRRGESDLTGKFGVRKPRVGPQQFNDGKINGVHGN